MVDRRLGRGLDFFLSGSRKPGTEPSSEKPAVPTLDKSPKLEEDLFNPAPQEAPGGSWAT